jgi:hypothetical protein
MQSTQAWQDLAITSFIQGLPVHEQRQFQQAFVQGATFERVLAVLKSQNILLQSKRKTKIILRLEKISRPLQRLSDAVDVIVQAQSEIGLVWGPLRAAIMVRQPCF